MKRPSYRNPDPRLVKGVVMLSPSKEDVAELRRFVRSVEPECSVKQHKTVHKVTAEIHQPYHRGPGDGSRCATILNYLIDNGWVQWPYGENAGLINTVDNALKYDAFYDIGLLMKIE